MKRIILSISFILMAIISFAQNGVDGIVLEKYYISDANDATAFGLPIGSTTYRLWVDLHAGYKLNSVWGDPSHNLKMQSTTNFFNSPSFDKAFASQINAAKLNLSATMIDSWLSFGYAANGKLAVQKADDTTGSYISAYAFLQNADPLAGTALKIKDGIVTGSTATIGTLGLGTATDVFDATATQGNQFLVTGGSYFLMGGTTGYGANNLVLIAQLTTDGYLSYQLNLSVQNTTSGVVEDWVWNTPTPGASPTQYTASFLSYAQNQLPSVTVTAPASGATYTVGDIVHITANASDPDGTVANVEFLVDGSVVGSSAISPYSFDWTSTTPNGTRIITARATDDQGGVKTSTGVNINIGANTPPTVVITSPTEAATFSSTGAAITISANASDVMGGTITNVEFLVDGIVVGNDPTSPYSISWPVGSIGNHTLTARATDNGGAITTSAPIHITIFNGNASYQIQNQTQLCNESSLCMIISKMSTNLVDCIGFDFNLVYDATKVVPTGNITVYSSMLTNPGNNASYTTHIFPAEHRMLVSIFLSPSAPLGTSWHGQGNICCIEFNKTSGFGASAQADFSIDQFQESYYNGVNSLVIVQPGTYTSMPNHIFTGNLLFWNGAQPIVYDPAHPASYLITTIWPGSLPSSPITPDLTGSIIYDINLGSSIGIHRDILATTDVMPVINGQDALLTKKVLVDDLSFIPSIYQIIAMDVNQDGVVSAGDLTQINLRTIHKINEFKQAWNYGSNGSQLPSYKPSFDWVFLNNAQLDAPAFTISSNYPLDDTWGYSKYRVPILDSLKHLPISSDACPVISNATFQGILLGDVNGNYKEIASDGLIKGCAALSNDKVILHLGNTSINNDFLEIPVTVSSSDEVHAIDFSILFNTNNYKFVGIENIVPGMQSDGYVSTDDATLRVTSFTEKNFPVNMTIMKLKFAMINPDVKMNINPGLAFTNGNQSKLRLQSATDQMASNVNIYPNPANNELFVVASEDASLQLLDITGKIVTTEIYVKAEQIQMIKTTNLTNGVYFLKIRNGNNDTTKKIVITH